MNAKFYPVSLAEKDQYYEFWQATPRRSLDYSLVNLWGWQEYFGLEWHFADGLCWIRQTRPEPVCWAPLGDWGRADWQGLFERYFENRKWQFTRVPEELANLWLEALPENIRLEEDRGQWEYLYLQSDLANLSGARFHKKKNHYNSYVKAYGEPGYEQISPSMVDAVLGVQDHWCQWHECEDSPSLQAENEAIRRVLTHWEQFRHMYGGALRVNGEMIAFSVGEKLDEETLGVHFEKGLNGYKGVYQAMNLQFARHAGEGFKWINRAQDLDEEGLRQAKMTYMPADFLRKFRVTLN
ncbi:MAG: DUF2156 domain-containing protein [Desulfovibrio sp.]|nr:DUF2156 domain-containing protein [Desulfovibrio sp.]